MPVRQILRSCHTSSSPATMPATVLVTSRATTSVSTVATLTAPYDRRSRCRRCKVYEVLQCHPSHGVDMRAEWTCTCGRSGHAVDMRVEICAMRWTQLGVLSSMQRPDFSQLVGVGNAMLLIKVPYKVPCPPDNLGAISSLTRVEIKLRSQLVSQRNVCGRKY